jgi:hypothetical protein
MKDVLWGIRAINCRALGIWLRQSGNRIVIIFYVYVTVLIEIIRTDRRSGKWIRNSDGIKYKRERK